MNIIIDLSSIVYDLWMWNKTKLNLSTHNLYISLPYQIHYQYDQSEDIQY
jgi:hypothetical protein